MLPKRGFVEDISSGIPNLGSVGTLFDTPFTGVEFGVGVGVGVDSTT